MKQWLKLSANVYRWLLHLYPANFRDNYGDEMLLLFRDVSRDAAYDGHGALLTVWLYALADLVVNASAERLKQMLTREWLVETVVSVSGLAMAVLSGLFMAWIVLIITVFLLVPWDIGIPPAGTLAAAVNYFFERGFVPLPAALVLLFDVVAFFKAALSGWYKTSTLYWRFTAMHIGVTVVSGSLTAAVMTISRILFPNTITWEGDQSNGVALVYGGLLIVGGTLGFFAYQMKNAPNLPSFKRKHKHKRLIGGAS